MMEAGKILKVVFVFESEASREGSLGRVVSFDQAGEDECAAEDKALSAADDFLLGRIVEAEFLAELDSS